MKMKQSKKIKLQNELEGVIDSARKIRDYMLNDNIPLSERKQEIATMRTANEANKTIVSSVINTVAIEKMGE